jgi:hypothetical protein
VIVRETTIGEEEEDDEEEGYGFTETGEEFKQEAQS